MRVAPVRVIIGGIGYRNLRDHSVGVMIADQLMSQTWAESVAIEDVSYNPIAVGQRLQAEPQPFERAILIAGVSRNGRLPGTITAYRWDGAMPNAEEIQRAVADAVTGIIHVDNTVIVSRYFGGLPADVVLIEIEPAEHEFGETLSAPVAQSVEPVCALVRRLVAGQGDQLPIAPLGGSAIAIGIR